MLDPYYYQNVHQISQSRFPLVGFSPTSKINGGGHNIKVGVLIHLVFWVELGPEPCCCCL
jgi:hypothetical protein